MSLAVCLPTSSNGELWGSLGLATTMVTDKKPIKHQTITKTSTCATLQANIFCVGRSVGSTDHNVKLRPHARERFRPQERIRGVIKIVPIHSL